jgi:glutathione synthase/RimK-type ligase-like ATP-grasp enzyme
MSAVLITGARAPIALDMARSFGAAGHDPHLVDTIRPWAVRLSGATREQQHRLASPRFAFPRFATNLADLVRRLDAKLVVPMCEEVFYVAEAAKQHGFADRVFAPAPETLRRLHSKVEFAGLASACGVSAPATERVTSIAELSAFRKRAGELVFKPEFSRFASHALIRPRADALDRLRPTPEAPWAVQEYVAGGEVCIWSAARAGEVVAFCAYRPRWRVGRSASFYFEADRDPRLLHLAQTIARATGASGQLSFDVIRRADGSITPIECNPRGVSGLHLFDGAPRLAEALLGASGLQTVNAEARHLGPAMWLLGAPQALVQGRIGVFLNDLTRSRDALSGAATGALMDAARFAMLGISRGRSASGQSTDDIEWNGEPIR